MNELQAVSYSGNSLQYQVLMLNQDFANQVATMTPISRSLDYPRLNRYRVGECVITLNDPDGDFAPDNQNNIFIRNGESIDGYGVELEIKAGYLDILKTKLKGRIIRLTFDSVLATAEIVVGDSLHNLFSKDITDFGESKQFGLVANTEPSLNGVYDLPEYILPVSKESVEVKKSASESLTEVAELADRGFLNSDNYAITNDGIETEGGEVSNASVGYPQISLKAPFRYKDVEFIIENLLEQVGITESDIEIPDINIGDNFSSNGRIGYDVIGTQLFGTSNPITWIGYPTDWIYDDAENKYYILYNPKLGNIGNRAFIIEYDDTTKLSRVLYRPASIPTATIEYWKIAKSGNFLAILATDSGTQTKGYGALPDIEVPRTGSYDSTQSGNSSYIFFLDLRDNSINRRVRKNSGIKAQVGHYYMFGQTISDNRAPERLATVRPQQPPFIQPDTRHSLMFHSVYVYYVYTNPTHVGVARVGLTSPAESVIAMPLDGQGNQCGLDFFIANDELFVIGTYKGNSNSRLIAFKTPIT